MIAPTRLRPYQARGPRRPNVCGSVPFNLLEKARAAGKKAVVAHFGAYDRWTHEHRLVYMRAYWAVYSRYPGARLRKDNLGRP